MKLENYSPEFANSINWKENKEVKSIVEQINKLDDMIERVKEEIYENNSQSNREWLTDLRKKRKKLIEQKENIKKDQI